MKRFYLYLSGLFWFVLPGLQAQKIIVYNRGELYVEGDLYLKGDFQAEEESKIFQKGITELTGDFINEVKTGNVFTTEAAKNTGTFEFCGTAAQQIKGSALKEQYINFPDTLRINNKAGTVTMLASQAATAKVVDIRNGRLILDSEAAANSLVNAHLLIEKDVTGNPNNIQVNLELGDNYQKRKLVGFTPPFEKLYADYFFFNFLSRPTAEGLFGDDGRLITNPRTLLKPGLGYLVGMGVVPEGDPYYTDNFDPRWSDADFSKRATDKFFFSRAVAEPSFSKYLNEQLAPGYVAGEKLVIKDVAPISLEKGFNYLGNPYMAPLDLSDIINGTTSADWGVADNTLKHGFYVLSQGTGAYADSRFTFSASYLISQKVGSTTNHTRSVAPMQMFIVGTDTPVSIRIPKNKRKHDSTAKFLRSANYEITDELLIETTDNETGGYDRLCIVFRNSAALQSGDPFDAVKIFNRSGGVNQIYTRSSDDKDMTVSVIPPTTEKLPLYFMPALLPQQVTLKVERLNSLLSVGYVILEDTKTGALTDLLRTPTYSFTSSPSDRQERFVLHFTPASATAAESVNRPAPYAFYEEGLIQIHGLRESDRGSELDVFDMQGRLIHRQRLTETTPCLIRKDLNQGVYMVKNKSAVLKFAVK
jgi:hypothetical protein